jgi:hypothetical protein
LESEIVVSTASPRRQVLRLVPKAKGGIDADTVAYTVMAHVGTMYPAIWLAVPKTA